MPTPRFERIRANPSLLPGLADDLGPAFPWHTHAASPRSSQALCLSAWAPLRHLAVRHAVVEALLAASLPGLAERHGAGGTRGDCSAAEAEAEASWRGPLGFGARDVLSGHLGPSAWGADRSVGRGAGSSCERRWKIRLEVSDPEILQERGGRASCIDVLLEAGDAVVCVESKFLRDAAAGLPGCSQFPEACRGFYGPGSDRKCGTSAPCRLAASERGRTARVYWDVAAGLFRPERLNPAAGEPGSCPLHRHFQLARNLLFAARYAELRGKRLFAALMIAPRASAELLEAQTAAFAQDVLSPALVGRVGVAHYELLVALLASCGEARAAAVGAFVSGLLPVPAPRVRAETARELRRRAEAGRHGALRRVQ